MKFTHIWFLLLVFCSACNQKKEIKAPEETIPVQNADFGALYQYYHANPTSLEQKEENQIIEYIAEKNGTATRSRSGVYIVNHVEGAGDSIKWGDPISVHYRGYLLGGDEFDSSLKRGEPISFRVGSMVAGWNEALPFLKVGSKATFLIPSHMGYGKRGFPGFVGPDEILAFDIEILEKRKEKGS